MTSSISRLKKPYLCNVYKANEDFSKKVGKIDEKKKNLLGLPPEMVQSILEFLEPRDQLSFALTSKTGMILVLYPMKKGLYEKQCIIGKTLEHFIAILPEEEKKKACILEKTLFQEPYVAKLRNSAFKTACIYLRFLQEEREKFSLKVQCILHDSVGLPIEDGKAIADKLLSYTITDDTYEYLCKKILTEKSLTTFVSNRVLHCVNALYLGVLKIKDPAKKFQALERVSEWYHWRRLLSNAVDVARQISDASIRSLRLQSISLEYEDQGNKSIALGLLDEAAIFGLKILDFTIKSKRLFDISLSYQVYRDLEKALVVARQIPDDLMRSNRIKSIEYHTHSSS